MLPAEGPTLEFGLSAADVQSIPGATEVDLTINGEPSRAALRYLPAAYATVDGFVMYYDELANEVGGDFSRTLVHLTGERPGDERINAALWRDYDDARPRPADAAELRRTLAADVEREHRRYVDGRLAAGAPQDPAVALYDAAGLYLQTVHHLDDTLVSVAIERVGSAGGETILGVRLMSFDRRTGARLRFDAAALDGARERRLRAELLRRARLALSSYGREASEAELAAVAQAPLDNAARVAGGWLFAPDIGASSPPRIVVAVADGAWR